MSIVTIALPGGRAFLHAESGIDRDEVEAGFRGTLFDEDDQERLSVLESALSQGTVSFDIYPGETSPVEFHAYLRTPDNVFACVLAPMTVVEHLISMPPYIVFETASFQVVEGVSLVELMSGLEAWIARMWPENLFPKTMVVSVIEEEIK